MQLDRSSMHTRFFFTMLRLSSASLPITWRQWHHRSLIQKHLQYRSIILQAYVYIRVLRDVRTALLPNQPMTRRAAHFGEKSDLIIS